VVVGVVVLLWALRIRRRRNRGESGITDEQGS
jgi:hypothetical protein